MIHKFMVQNKKYRHLLKKHLSREAMQMIRKKQRLWKAYKRTGKVEDYIKYKDALKETTNEITKLAANIKGTRHKQNSLSGNTLFNYMPTYTRSQKKS